MLWVCIFLYVGTRVVAVHLTKRTNNNNYKKNNNTSRVREKGRERERKKGEGTLAHWVVKSVCFVPMMKWPKEGEKVRVEASVGMGIFLMGVKKDEKKLRVGEGEGEGEGDGDGCEERGLVAGVKRKKERPKDENKKRKARKMK